MTPAEWAEVERLFDRALQMPDDERAAWLNQVCPAPSERRALLDRLLTKFYEASPDVRDETPMFARGQLVAGRFRILELIARGGMGEVYKARDQKLHDVQIALKTIRPGLALGRASLERFLREVWVPREIADDGICRIFELVEHKQVDHQGNETVIPCLTMQFLEGDTLAAYLAGRRPLPLDQALAIASRLGRSLQALHDQGIVHRDLKPSNVMLVRREDGSLRPVIIDFGLAKRALESSLPGDTRSMPLPGAPYFLAPEVFTGDKGSVASDVYSFGVLIDTMVTARNAYAYESDEELLYRKLKEDPLPPSARADGLPSVWEDVILACLRMNPAARPARVVDAVRLLEGDPEAPSLPVVPAVQGAAVAPPPGRVSRRLWMAAAGAASAGGALAGYAALSPAPLMGAVLVPAFRNLTTKPEFNQICLGVETELVRRLRALPGLQVYLLHKDWKPDRADLDKARLSLEGSLQFADGVPLLSLRVSDNASAQLLAERKVPLPPANMATAYDEVAQQVLTELSSAFGANWTQALLRRVLPSQLALGQLSLPKQATRVNAALLEYERGQQIALTRTPASALEAISSFERAIAHDPQFALAYAALADIRQVLLLFNWGDTRELLTQALQNAEKAVSMDASLPECHVSLAAAAQNLWDWPRAEHSYLAAIQANRGFPKAYSWFGGFVLQFGRAQEALTLARRGLELDPFDQVQQASFGLYLWLAGQTGEAVAHLEKLIPKGNIINTYINLGQAYAALARDSAEPAATLYYTKSLDAAAEVSNREKAAAGGEDPGYLKWSDLIRSQAHASRGDLNTARHHARRLEKGLEAGAVSASAVARAYAVTNDRRRALELLELGQAKQEREMLYLRVHPLYRNLHAEPAYRELLQQMRLA